MSEIQFQEHIAPYLSTAKSPFSGRLPLYKVFNYILYRLHTGCQWAELPIGLEPASEKKNSVTAPFTTIFPGGVTTEV
jgi:transposase